MTRGFDHLRTISERAIEEGVTPAVGLVVGQGGKNLYLAALGHAALVPETLPVALDYVWDLASLTKPLVTSLLAMQAVAEGRLGLGQTLSVGPQGDERQVTLRQLLSHSAGFEAHAPLYLEAGGGAKGGSPTLAGRQAVVKAARDGRAAYSPGTRSIYSDLGFIVLGDWLETVFGARLDRLAQERIFSPLGIAGLFFVPLWSDDSGSQASPAVPVERFVATQHCPVRERVLRGEVDDLNAYALGGVSGHAGLFGTLEAVAVLAHALMAAVHGPPASFGGPQAIDPAVLRTFWSPAGVPGSTWRLGWDGPAAVSSLAGDRISRRAVGHLAFTGCSLWIDPQRETFVLILTNRIHLGPPTDPRFAAFRRELGDAALAAIDYVV